ncbi:MAG TPA: allantoinase AllB [Nocardioidaceae bacterium]|nr:allantoinase AllB [Nocardioidaceae bacterium]
MRADLVVRAGRAVVDHSEQACAVVVRAGTVAEILSLDAPVAAEAELRLADDEVLLPGLVDTHVHVDEPGRTEWEGFATATAAAAAGGVTTIVDMPLNSVPPTVDVAALDVKRKAAAEQCLVDVGFWGGAVPGKIADLDALHAAGVFGVKCFLLDSGVEEFPPLDAAGLREAMTAVAAFGGLLLVHAEDADVIEAAPAARGRQYAGFLASRPHEAEDAAIRVVLDEARATGARVHLVHLASADALRMVAHARADGVRVSVETCPHYLALTADDVPDGSTEFKCCPPIRDAGNRDGLWRGLADGVVDIVVSDHSPCPPELKHPGTGDFGAAWGGIASLQLGLAVVWTEARTRGRTLVDVVRWMASGPADVAGLPHKGRIAVGADADLVVFAPEQTTVVDPARLLHRHPVTPYAGRELAGVVRRTLLRGRPIDGEPRGRLLRRGEA